MNGMDGWNDGRWNRDASFFSWGKRSVLWVYLFLTEGVCGNVYVMISSLVLCVCVLCSYLFLCGDGKGNGKGRIGLGLIIELSGNCRRIVFRGRKRGGGLHVCALDWISVYLDQGVISPSS
jgi:hypothetical protein